MDYAFRVSVQKKHVSELVCAYLYMCLRECLKKPNRYTNTWGVVSERVHIYVSEIFIHGIYTCVYKIYTYMVFVYVSELVCAYVYMSLRECL